MRITISSGSQNNEDAITLERSNGRGGFVPLTIRNQTKPEIDRISTIANTAIATFKTRAMARFQDALTSGRTTFRDESGGGHGSRW
jgi:hypothetical protein